ncbi:hypothetical protein [Duganella callida]|nr:hypothetical protein [Duganella callida]
MRHVEDEAEQMRRMLAATERDLAAFQDVKQLKTCQPPPADDW